jgi:hypothetical protein
LTERILADHLPARIAELEKTLPTGHVVER